MNEEQRAAAARLVDNMNLSLETWIEQAENLLRELLAAEPVQDEPVAWLKTMYSGTRPILEVDHRKPPATNSIPVYAAPQQQAEPVQEPKPTTASQFESVKEAKRAAEYELRYYRKMMDEKNAAEPQGEPVAWHVCSVNSDGSLSLEFAAPWEELAHEHINDAINEHDIDGAASWVVRPVYTHPPQQSMRCPEDGGECGAGGYCRPERRRPAMQAEIECDCLTAWNASTYGHSAHDTVHPMFLAAFVGGYKAAERAHGITGEPT